MLRGDTATTAFQGYWPSPMPVQPRTRVRGSDLPLEAASGPSCTSTPRTRWASTCTYGGTASVRPIVTNLRLPGQYDERLLGSVGLQGPYYNWNRWYLPGVGRYLEPDPIALRGELNTEYSIDWYNYAEGNPLSKTDPFGLDAEVCWRPFYPRDIGYPRHCFVRFDGDDDDTLSFDNKGVGPDPAPPDYHDRVCKPTQDEQDDDCMKKEMKKCKGWWYDIVRFNCCDCVKRALKKCKVNYDGGWPNWPVN